MVITLSLLIISLSILFAFVILEFIVPLIFKNGQTVGKKIFSIAIMRADSVRISPAILFVRSILGKYTVGTMIPVIMGMTLIYGIGSIVTLAVAFLIPLFQIILMFVTKTNLTIHDILSSTVAVDIQSQMIFESVEAKQEYLRRIHEEEAKSAKY